MEKAIEIKRRAQRCVQNGDLDGALAEYEKLIQVEDSDPYNFVLLADLHFKKGDLNSAAQRYLTAAAAYEKAGLYKNAIAVCKKMLRLSLSPSSVLERLAALHALDGLTTESALYYMQFAEGLVREDRLEEAATSLRKAFDTCPENIKGLERLAEVQVLLGDKPASSTTWLEAATNYQRAGLLQDADRCRARADQLSGGAAESSAASAPAPAPARPAAYEVHDPTALSLPGTAEAHVGPPRLPSLVTSEPEVADAEPEIAIEEPAPTAETAPPRFEAPRLETVEREMASFANTVAPGAAAQGIEHGSSLAPAPPPAAIEVPEDAPAEAAEVIEEAPVAEDEAPVGVAPHATAEAPGLAFASASAPAAADPEAEAAERRAAQVRRVEDLLQLAQSQFRAGERDAASHTLVEAAGAYDSLGQHDSAATIYRSLGKSTHAGREVMTLWLQNCELRRDHVEAAQVACELGDRSLNEGDNDSAKGWFERALAYDASNAVARRRLQRLTGDAGAPALAAAPVGAAPDSPQMEMGRVEVAVGRGEAVTFDLGSLVAEFQRGVEVQLGGDPQGHYDLGMTYREMGLLEQAVDSFRTAGRTPGFELRCAEMVGRCLLDQGRFDEAAAEFQGALSRNHIAPEMAADLHYQLGLAHESAGRAGDALASFERSYAIQPNNPEVVNRIRALRPGPERR